MTTSHSLSNPPGSGAAAKACQTELQLNKGNHLRLRAAQDMRLSTVRGTAWITVENDAGETLVDAGDAFVISSGKTALVGPLRESVTLALGAAPLEPARAASRPVLSKLRRLLGIEHGLGFGMV